VSVVSTPFFLLRFVDQIATYVEFICIFPTATPITDLPSLLRREAVFTAAGRLARSLVLNPNIPPSQFLIALADESISAPNLLRRRIAWLIGELVDAEEDLASNELVWTTLLRLVGKGGLGSGEDNDFGVRLAAAGGLRAAMDLWESDASCFEVYVSTELPLLTVELGCVLMDLWPPLDRMPTSLRVS
jgi:hypothetical protein